MQKNSSNQSVKAAQRRLIRFAGKLVRNHTADGYTVRAGAAEVRNDNR